MRFFISFLSIISLSLIIGSCSKDKQMTANGDWLFPIAKGELSIASLGELSNLKYTVNIPPVSLGQPVGVPVISPGLNIDHVGPFALEITPWLHRVDLDTIEINAQLTNFFPIPIGAGTEISIRNTPDGTSTTNVIGRTVIPNDIASNQAFSVDFKSSNTFMGDSVYFFLDRFTSPAFANVVFDPKPATLVVTLKVIKASLAQLYNDKEFASIDTAAFKAGDTDNLGSGSGGVVSDTSVSGFINVFLDNSLPTNLAFQAYFLDESKSTVIDSLFINEMKINGVVTDASGTPAGTNSTVTKVNITRKRIDNIKKAAYVVTKINFNTKGNAKPIIAANRQARLAIQLTGDLNIKISF